MKKLIITTAAIGFLAGYAAMAIPSSGLIINEQVGQYQYSDGGEFLMTLSGGQQFTTWCIEVNHEFAWGDHQSYTLGQTTHGAPPLGASSVLNNGTALLFDLWAGGGLGSLTIGNNTQAGEFQQALWYFQDQGQHFTGTGFNITDDPYYALAVGVLGNTVAYQASNGAYGVNVVQTTDITSPQYTGQDYLAIPDGGMTAGLLGCALVGVQVLRRKLA